MIVSVFHVPSASLTFLLEKTSNFLIIATTRIVSAPCPQGSHQTPDCVVVIVKLHVTIAHANQQIVDARVIASHHQLREWQSFLQTGALTRVSELNIKHDKGHRLPEVELLVVCQQLRTARLRV